MTAAVDGPGRASWDDGSASHRFRVVPAAYVLLRRGDAVLLQLRQGTGYRDGFWAAAAAGHVEAGESVVAAAVREAREELGVEIDPADLRPLTALHRGEPGGPALEQRADFFFATRPGPASRRSRSRTRRPTCGGSRWTPCPTRSSRTSCTSCAPCGRARCRRS